MTRTTSGFPSPAADYQERSLDLNRQLIRHPASTFPFRVQGGGFENMGIHGGDVLLVDRQMPMKAGDLVVAAALGECLLLLHQGHGRFMDSHGKEAQPEDIFGPVVALIRTFR